MRKLIASLGLLTGVLTLAGTARAGFTGPYYGFAACEIAHPDSCELIGLWRTRAACTDMLGTFLGHHDRRTHAIDGPGIAQLEGLAVPGDCVHFGLKRAWYHYDHGALSAPLSLKRCAAESTRCFGPGLPNNEQGFKKQ